MDLRKLLEIDDEFQAWQVNATNRDLIKLMRLGIVKITLKTNKNTYWKVVDKEKLERWLKLSETVIKLPKDKPLFESIINHDLQKEVILRGLKGKQHMLLLGSPATAKTLFLLELTKVNGIYVTPYITYSGLFDILLMKPKILLIDQIDNLVDKSVYRLLIDAMEYGFVTKITHNLTLKDKIDTVIIATANETKRIPKALMSRFLVIRFKPYSEEEYRKVVRDLLKDKNKELVDYIIEKTKDYRDIRNALKLARICKNREDVDKFLEVIRLSY